MTIRVTDFLAERTVTFRRDDDARQAGEELAAGEHLGGVVIDDRQVAIGVLTLSDCLRGLLAGTYYATATPRTVGSLMSAPPDVVFAHDPLDEIVLRVLARPHSIFPVVDKHHKLVGLLRRCDLYRAYAAALRERHTPGVPSPFHRDVLTSLRPPAVGPASLSVWLPRRAGRLG
jgi:CBS-domain-containing membrane protein